MSTRHTHSDIVIKMNKPERTTSCPRKCGGYVAAEEDGTPKYSQCWHCHVAFGGPTNQSGVLAPVCVEDAPECATKLCEQRVGIQRINKSKFYKYCAGCMHTKYKCINNKGASPVAEGYNLP